MLIHTIERKNEFENNFFQFYFKGGFEPAVSPCNIFATDADLYVNNPCNLREKGQLLLVKLIGHRTQKGIGIGIGMYIF